MSNAATPHRWFQGWRAGAAPVDTDPADLGTAFGLELSMSNAEWHAPTPRPPTERQPGWLRRLTARRKPLA
jgi:hypothetical protein